jgi:YggT family protein
VTIVIASARSDIAGLILVYIVVNLLFAAGLRPPYSRTTDRLLAFLRDVVEPYLRIFRRFSPRLGGLDFSPMLAIIALYVVNIVVVQGIIS